jgi:hypothetical protein
LAILVRKFRDFEFWKSLQPKFSSQKRKKRRRLSQFQRLNYPKRKNILKKRNGEKELPI